MTTSSTTNKIAEKTVDESALEAHPLSSSSIGDGGGDGGGGGCLGRWRTQWSFDGNRGAKAWCYAAAAQGVLLAASSVTAIPLLKLAEAAAGCENLSPGDECRNKVRGFVPSSLLSLMQTVTGVGVAVSLPFVGALIDRTPYRRHVAIASIAIVVAWNYAAIMISRDTWFVVAVGMSLCGVAYFTHTMTMYAYIPELSSDNDKLTLYNSNFMIVRAAVMVPFLMSAGALTILLFRHLDKRSLDFEVAFVRVLCGTEATSVAVLMYLALLHPRGLGDVPAKVRGRASCGAALGQLRDTAVAVFRDHRPLFWYMVAVVPYANSVVSAAVISVTFLVSFVKATTPQIGVSAGIVLLFSALGSRTHYLVASRVGLLNDVRINMCLWITLCLWIGLAVTGPERLRVFYGCAVLFGTLVGWANPAQRMLFVALMPKGRETEFMGVFMFVSSGFTWTNPLLFTFLNEQGVPMNMIVLMGCLPFGAALAITFLIGNFDDAVAAAAACSTSSSSSNKKEDRLRDDDDERRVDVEGGVAPL